MRRLQTTVTVVLLLLVPTALGLPTPGQDDAGTGGDAGDSQEAATRIPLGTHQGTLVTRVDEVDYYLVSIDQPGVLEVEIETEHGIFIDLFDPDGVERQGLARFDGGTGAWERVGFPTGDWIVGLDLFSPAETPVESQYELTLRLEPKAYTAQVSNEDPAGATVTADLPQEGEWVFESYTRTAKRSTNGYFTAVDFQLFESNAPWEVISMAVARINGGEGESTIWIEGDVPAEVSKDEVLPSGSSGGSFSSWSSFTEETSWTSTTFGAVGSGETTLAGWIVSDVPIPRFEILDGTRGEFLGVQSCETAGTGLQAGSFIWVDDASCALSLNPGITFLEIDGRAPGTSVREPAITVNPPEGEPVDISGDSVREAIEFTEQLETWTIDIDHLDGGDEDRHRFVAASFPVPDGFQP